MISFQPAKFIPSHYHVLHHGTLVADIAYAGPNRYLTKTGNAHEEVITEYPSLKDAMTAMVRMWEGDEAVEGAVVEGMSVTVRRA